MFSYKAITLGKENIFKGERNSGDHRQERPWGKKLNMEKAPT